MRAANAFGAILTRLDQAIAEIRRMALTIELGRIAAERWHAGFRDAWLDLLNRSAIAVHDADAEPIKAVPPTSTGTPGRSTSASCRRVSGRAPAGC
jgi:antirestriction protein ArdC